jgi:hypothetical protein
MSLALIAFLTRPGVAGNYEFLAAPQKDLNRIYRLDKVTGEVAACQYGLSPGKEDIAPGAIGVTLCYPPGEGAGRQEAGEYGLVASHHEQEGGVFRVDFHSGMMSVCFVFKDAVVCTAPGGDKSMSNANPANPKELCQQRQGSAEHCG